MKLIEGFFQGHAQDSEGSLGPSCLITPIFSVQGIDLITLGDGRVFVTIIRILYNIVAVFKQGIAADICRASNKGATMSKYKNRNNMLAYCCGFFTKSQQQEKVKKIRILTI